MFVVFFAYSQEIPTVEHFSKVKHFLKCLFKMSNIFGKFNKVGTVNQTCSEDVSAKSISGLIV